MKIVIIYHSGVGSTKTIAKCIEEKLRELHEVSIFSVEENIDYNVLSDSDFLIFGFPTYHCEPSFSIEKFIDSIQRFEKPKWSFSFTTYGLYSANTLRIFTKKLLDKNILTAYSSSYRSPASDGVLVAPKIKFLQSFEKNILEKIQSDVQEVIIKIETQEKISKVPHFKIYSILNAPNKFLGKLFKRAIYINSELCIKCNKCVTACPHGCLEMDDKKENLIFIKENCESCYRCIHLCPCQALSLDKKRKPEVQLQKIKLPSIQKSNP